MPRLSARTSTDAGHPPVEGRDALGVLVVLLLDDPAPARPHPQHSAVRVDLVARSVERPVVDTRGGPHVPRRPVDEDVLDLHLDAVLDVAADELFDLGPAAVRGPGLGAAPARVGLVELAGPRVVT